MATRPDKNQDRYIAISTWNFKEPNVPTDVLVREFGAMGFNAMSFTLLQLFKLTPPESRALRSVLEETGLAVTLHGGMESWFETAFGPALETLGRNLKCITFDAPLTSDSRGPGYDLPRMAQVLAQVAPAAEKLGARFGMEDFPLDDYALELYRQKLGAFLGNPLLGMLVDLGHMHIKLSKHAYFAGRTVAQYLAGIPLPIIETHVHDNDGERDLHQPLGDGTLPFDQAAKALVARKFDGVSTIEIAPSFHGRTAAASKPLAAESLQQWRALLEKAREK